VNLQHHALHHAGLLRATSVNSLLLHHLAMAAIVPFLWTLLGHAMAFTTTGMVEGHIGWRSFVSEVDVFSAIRSWSGNVTDGALHMLFQLAPAILAPCILVGAVAERIKPGASIVMSTLWLPCVYIPILHATHAGPGSFLGDLGVLDAGGTFLFQKELKCFVFPWILEEVAFYAALGCVCCCLASKTCLLWTQRFGRLEQPLLLLCNAQSCLLIQIHCLA
jgi:hypothetical protein